MGADGVQDVSEGWMIDVAELIEEGIEILSEETGVDGEGSVM